jgi:hypothetical protein
LTHNDHWIVNGERVISTDGSRCNGGSSVVVVLPSKFRDGEGLGGKLEADHVTLHKCGVRELPVSCSVISMPRHGPTFVRNVHWSPVVHFTDTAVTSVVICEHSGVEVANVDDVEDGFNGTLGLGEVVKGNHRITGIDEALEVFIS